MQGNAVRVRIELTVDTGNIASLQLSRYKITSYPEGHFQRPDKVINKGDVVLLFSLIVHVGGTLVKPKITKERLRRYNHACLSVVQNTR